MRSLRFSVESGFGDLLKQDMYLPVDHSIALVDDGFRYGLSQMAFSRARWTPKTSHPHDERRMWLSLDRRQAAIHLLVEVEIEVIECHLRIAKLCLFPAPLQESVTAAS